MAGRERETLHPDAPRRRALKVAVSALCAEAGFGHAQNCALETLAEMIQSCEFRVSLARFRRVRLALDPWALYPSLVTTQCSCLCACRG